MLISYRAYFKIISYHRIVCEREKVICTRSGVLHSFWNSLEGYRRFLCWFVNNIYIWSLFFLKLKKYYETSNKFAFDSFYLENITTMKIILKFGIFWLYVKSPKLKPSPLKLCCN